jgi:hypothetical protein
MAERRSNYENRIGSRRQSAFERVPEGQCPGTSGCHSQWQAVAVLLAVGDDEDLERLLMAHSPKLQAILAAARQRIREGKGIPHEQFWKQVEKDRGIKGSGKREKNDRTKRST